MSLNSILVGLAFVGLFAFAMVGFAGQIAIDNNANQSLLDDPRLSGLNTTISNNLLNISNEATQREADFASSDPDKSSESGFGITAIFGTVLAFISSAIGVFDLILNVAADTLGINALFLQISLGALIITLLLLGWRVIKAGGT